MAEQDLKSNVEPEAGWEQAKLSSALGAEPETTERAAYTPTPAARLIIESFRFSQGGLAVQVGWLSYLRTAHPECMTLEKVLAAKETVIKLAEEYTRPDSHMKFTAVEHHEAVAGMVNTVYGQLESLLNRRPQESTPENLRNMRLSLMMSMIGGDYDYLRANATGRKRSVDDSGGEPTTNSRYLSQFAFYGLEGHPTPVEYREVFEQFPQLLGECWDEEIRLREGGYDMRTTTVGLAAQAVVGRYWQVYPSARENTPAELRELIEHGPVA